MVLGVVGIALMVVGFVGPWWTINTSASDLLGQTVSSAAEFHLFGGTTTFTSPPFSRTNTTDYGSDPNIRSVFLVGATLSGVAVALGIMMMALAAMGGTRPSFGRLAAASGILAFVFGLLAVLYVMASLPTAVNQDGQGGFGSPQISGFWGRSSTRFFGVTTTVTWAAGWAWYVVLVGSVVFLIGGVLVMLPRKVARVMPPEAPQGPPESPPGP